MPFLSVQLPVYWSTGPPPDSWFAVGDAHLASEREYNASQWSAIGKVTDAMNTTFHLDWPIP